MSLAEVNGIQLKYETFGDKSNPAFLLIMGLGTQMIYWDAAYCQQLADRGFYVIRYDNRDVGLSTKLGEHGVPNVPQMMMEAIMGQPISVSVPYTLDHMADDAVGLLDYLGIDQAHLCGISMGGMIAQTVAFRYPERVLSLTSIMSSTGARGLPNATPEAMATLSMSSPSNREGYVENALKVWKIIAGSGFPFEEDRVRALAGEAFDRCFYPEGFHRHLAAILAHGDRTERLKQIKAPTLVIHGTEDPLVPFGHGEATAKAIAHAEFMPIEGMGHIQPMPTWAQIHDALERLARSV